VAYRSAHPDLAAEIDRIERRELPGNLSGTLYSGSLFVAADTPIGPVYFGYGRGQNSNSSWYFFVGRPYLAEHCRPTEFAVSCKSRSTAYRLIRDRFEPLAGRRRRLRFGASS
jgi:hypothetical protein